MADVARAPKALTAIDARELRLLVRALPQRLTTGHCSPGAARQRASSRSSVDARVGVGKVDAIARAIDRAAARAIGERKGVGVAGRERGVRAFGARATVTADVGVLVAGGACSDVADELRHCKGARVVLGVFPGLVIIRRAIDFGG
jgi:hypothetical protein